MPSPRVAPNLAALVTIRVREGPSPPALVLIIRSSFAFRRRVRGASTSRRSLRTGDRIRSHPERQADQTHSSVAAGPGSEVAFELLNLMSWPLDSTV